MHLQFLSRKKITWKLRGSITLLEKKLYHFYNQEPYSFRILFLNFMTNTRIFLIRINFKFKLLYILYILRVTQEQLRGNTTVAG